MRPRYGIFQSLQVHLKIVVGVVASMVNLNHEFDCESPTGYFPVPEHFRCTILECSGLGCGVRR